MLELSQEPFIRGKYVWKCKEIVFKDLGASPTSIVFLDGVEDVVKVSKQLKSLLDRKRPYLIYVRSKYNQELKKNLEKHQKVTMISFIHEFDDLGKDSKVTVYDFIEIDVKGDIVWWNKLCKLSKDIPAVYIVSNMPPVEEVKEIPANCIIV